MTLSPKLLKYRNHDEEIQAALAAEKIRKEKDLNKTKVS